MLTRTQDLTGKTDTQLREEIEELKKGIRKVKDYIREVGKKFWNAERARGTIKDTIYLRQVELGKRRAEQCPALRTTTRVDLETITLDSPRIQCWGRKSRPYTFHAPLLYARYCSTCKLPFNQLRTKMMVHKLEGKEEGTQIY